MAKARNSDFVGFHGLTLAWFLPIISTMVSGNTNTKEQGMNGFRRNSYGVWIRIDTFGSDRFVLAISKDGNVKPWKVHVNGVYSGRFSTLGKAIVSCGEHDNA